MCELNPNQAAINKPAKATWHPAHHGWSRWAIGKFTSTRDPWYEGLLWLLLSFQPKSSEFAVREPKGGRVSHKLYRSGNGTHHFHYRLLALCPCLLSIAVIETDQNHLGEGRVYWAYRSPSQSITLGVQGRSSNRNRGTDLLPLTYSACFLT